MASPIAKEQLLQLESFVKLCQNSPALLNEPSLKFFKEYLLSLGATLPVAENNASDDPTSINEETIEDVEEPENSEEEESEESDIELDNTGVIDPDDDEPAPQGDDNLEVTDEMLEESNDKRTYAITALNEGNFDEAIKFLTEAIIQNPQSAALYAKRAGVFLKKEKPNAAIRDCNKALSLNPDQPLAYKNRGRANRLLGNWEDAAKDLAIACKLDYTEEANEWLKEVMPNTKKLQEHKRKYERKHAEKELKERQARYQKAKEAQEKASKQNSSGGFGEFPGSGGFSRGSPFMAGGMQELLQDPDILEAFQDPEVAAAFQDISQNPANMAKYQSNPKIANVLKKITEKFGGEDTAGC